VSDVARDELALAPQGRIAAELHDVQRAQDGSQGVSELVAQHREEFVLETVGLLGFPEETDVVDREADSTSELLGGLAIVVLEWRGGPGAVEENGAHRAPSSGDGDRHRRDQPGANVKLA
jgi:hypothetical protein